MEIRTEAEARENIENFTKEYLKLLLHKKTIDQEIKDIKNNINHKPSNQKYFLSFLNILINFPFWMLCSTHYIYYIIFYSICQ